jgi:NADP-dependent 3-hydroxy acid dehydrogenase YdfG
MNLRDKIVVVTGAGSGIGRATALAFAKHGARIAACDVDQARLDSLRAELGDRALVIARVDVSDRSQMSGFAGQVHAVARAAHVVVNNAGVALGGSFLDTSLDDWKWVVDINLLGVVHGCHFFAPNMVEAKQGGHIVNISSIFGIYPATQTSAYVATKFAVRGFSLSLRDELARHGIGVTAICPGMIATEIVADGRMGGEIDAARKQKMTKLFARRGLPPAKVADAIMAAVETNPAVRTVGRDARMLAALTRLAPNSVSKLGSSFARRFL